MKPASSKCPVMGALLNDRFVGERGNGRTGLISLYFSLRRLGFGPVFAFIGFIPGAIVGNGWVSVPVNVFTLSVDLHRLLGGPIDHRGDTGVLDGGVFSADRFDRLLGFSSDGHALSVDDVARLIAADSAVQPSSMGRLMSCVEFAGLLRIFGHEPLVPGELGLRLPVSSLVSLYRDECLPAGWRSQRRTGILAFVLLLRRLIRASGEPHSQPGMAVK